MDIKELMKEELEIQKKLFTDERTPEKEVINFVDKLVFFIENFICDEMQTNSEDLDDVFICYRKWKVVLDRYYGYDYEKTPKYKTSGPTKKIKN